MKPRLYRHVDLLILLGLLALCYLLFFHRLGDVGLIGPDEPRYAAVAREMYLSGDYITPRLHGTPWFEKPPLMYWFAALGYSIFGINEWGARFPSALGASISVFLVYLCGRRLWHRLAGSLAAVIMASSIGFFAFARAASMDMPLTACLTMALVFFLIGYNDTSPARRWWFYAFYASLGLGALAKGPVALGLPMLSLAGFLVYRGKWSEWRSWHPEGLLLGLGIAAPWYIACGVVNGSEFIDVFFINQNFQRFTSTIHGHARPFYFYFPVLLLLTFPWTFLLLPTFRRRLGKSELILFWWAIVPFVVFSFSGSKLPGYILPMVPPIALLCGRELWQPWSTWFKAAVFIEAATMAFIGVAFGFFGSMLNVEAHVSGVLIAAITFGIAAALVAVALWMTPPALVSFNVVTMTLLVLAATNFVFPRFDRAETMRPWGPALEGLIPQNEVVFLYKPPRWMEYGLQFYRYNNARGIFSEEEMAGLIANQARILCIAEDRTLQELTRLGNLDLEIVNTIGRQSAFWVWQTE
jgi:4-amino-4-deoxy-L-arabinose transferase-like glycosyltransferase